HHGLHRRTDRESLYASEGGVRGRWLGRLRRTRVCGPRTATRLGQALDRRSTGADLRLELAGGKIAGARDVDELLGLTHRRAYAQIADDPGRGRLKLQAVRVRRRLLRRG